jgi:hypothetical protein
VGLAVVLFVAFFSSPGWGYSVLTHEQVVDFMWKDQLQPLLLKRFPGASEEDLRKAHAYAYGGSLLQDMGSRCEVRVPGFGPGSGGLEPQSLPKPAEYE